MSLSLEPEVRVTQAVALANLNRSTDSGPIDCCGCQESLFCGTCGFATTRDTDCFILANQKRDAPTFQILYLLLKRFCHSKSHDLRCE